MHIYSYIIQVLRFKTIEQHSIEKCISGGRAPHTGTARRREQDGPSAGSQTGAGGHPHSLRHHNEEGRENPPPTRGRRRSCAECT